MHQTESVIRGRFLRTKVFYEAEWSENGLDTFFIRGQKFLNEIYPNVHVKAAFHREESEGKTGYKNVNHVCTWYTLQRVGHRGKR